ncbi:uncharacterized protein LOC114726555 [Neltuma alba]|uniref:uncharacterized protein LOC114726555 n=1 Tax=Neltuma alba TaxID=207710 RepID=UPI0010A51A5F|nr:uncharacterized protein LOC114726555 [Prosopis alba]
MCFHKGEQMTSLQIHQMDQSEDWKKLQKQGGDEKVQKKQHFLPKRILQFVFSVSAFSFLLWYSFGCSILPHDESINAFFSTFLFSISSHIFERKYMFLLCNAILAFLSKTSLYLSDSDFDDRSLQSANAIPVSLETPSLMADQEQEKKLDHCEEEEQVSEADDDEEQEDGDQNIMDASAAKEDEEVGTTQDSTEVMVGTQDGEAEDDTTVAETEELSNADELNRKFEEFIRKMKEEIRIEAQRPLIAV